MTSEARSDYPLCGAKKKNGEECRAFAGQGTDHLGIGSCKYHGGSTPSHKTNAAKVEAQRKMVTMGAPVNITPAAALMGVLRATAGHVTWLATEVQELTSLDGPDAAKLTKLYAEERDRLTRVGAACLSAGIGKAEVELAEAQTEALAKAINAAFSHVGGLSHEQKRQFGQALRRELASLSAGDQALPVSTGADAAADPAADAVLV
jgi:hypothetical protein